MMSNPRGPVSEASVSGFKQEHSFVLSDQWYTDAAIVVWTCFSLSSFFLLCDRDNSVLVQDRFRRVMINNAIVEFKSNAQCCSHSSGEQLSQDRDDGPATGFQPEVEGCADFADLAVRLPQSGLKTTHIKDPHACFSWEQQK